MPALVSLTAFILGAALTTPLDAQVIFEADFETNTGTNAFGTGSDQWTVNPNATDTATTGVWERGNPDRTDYQPGVTPSGDFALVTGANAMDPNAADPLATSNGFNDIDGGPTSVLSPQIVLPSSVFGLELSFESYASFSGGAGDFFRLTIIEVGGAGTTQEVINIESSPLLFGQYQRTSVDLTPFAGRTITILLESGDLNGGSFVEAGIDDVRVTVLNPTVGGNVRYDVNGDGDLAAAFTEDGPLAGVDLSIFEGTPAGQITGPALQTVTSDRFGDFRFDNVPDGRYVVTSSTLAGAVSTGDSQGGNDDQIIVDIAGANINDLVFLDTTVAGGIPAATATYFLPYAESDILQALDTIESSAADPITSVTSISVAFDDTLILYDHWEDNGDEGYEGFLEAPAQALTQVWGDGNLVNGVAPGFPDDLLSAGDIIVLENTFETADAGSLPFYDGRDKVVVSKYVAVTKAAWADVSNTLLAGAWELYPTILWGRSFTLPVGEDMADAPAGETIPANQDDREMFEFTGASVMSAQDDNQVRLNGTLVAVLSEGEELTFNGGLNLGDRITTSRDAQVQLITGDVGATFESRWYTVQPDTNLSNSYVAPTSTPDGNGTLVWLYNGNDSEITIDIEISSNASLPDGNPDQSLADVPVPSLIVPPGRSVSYQLPNLKAARFSSQGEEIFFALAAVDASSPAEDNLTHDWGYSLVPEAFLSPLAVAGFAPGDDPTAEAVAENSAPLWVTAIFPTGSPNYQLNHDADPDNDVAITLCIDYQGNGNVDNLPTGGTDAASGREFDLQVTVESLEQLVIYTDLDGDGIPDPGEDQTGTRIWVCDGSDALIALAYGQDPNTASVGIPAVDLGTTVPGIPLLEVAKGVAVETDQNGNNFPDVGDVLRYTIDISNSGTAVFGASLIEITDNLNDFIRYVPDTTALVRTSGFDPIADNTVGSPFPIDSDGPTYVFPPSLQPEEGFAVTFLAEVIDLPANGTGALENNVVVAGGGNAENIQSAADIPIITGTIEGTVTEDTTGDAVGENLLDGVELILLRSDGTQVDFDESTPGVQPYTVTTLNGFYRFPNLPAGDYIVSQSQPAGFVSVSDGDSIDGTDDAPNTSLTDNQIPVSIGADEVDDGNDFVERMQNLVTEGAISGFVEVDSDNDDVADAPLPGVELVLRDAAGNDIDSDPNTAGIQPTVAITGFDGSYSFSGLAPGDFRVVQTQPSGFISVSDTDGFNDNVIGEENAIVVVAGGTNGQNNFLEEPVGSLSGNVSADSDGNGSGDQPLFGVVLTLQDDAGNDIDSDGNPDNGVQPTTTSTDSTGSYQFSNLAPGSYLVVETQPANFRSVSDADGGDLDVVGDQVPIIVTGEANTPGNNFVEEALGSVSGSVLAFTAASPDTAVAQPFVVVTLKDAAGNDIDSDGNPDNGVQPTTATTDEFGAYSFDNLPAADYQVVETQPAGFGSVSDIDGENNNTIGDENTLTVSPGETNSGNDFVNAELGSVSGNVTAFTAANAAGDAPLENVVLTLRDENGVDIDSNPATPEIEPTTTTTDSTGAYSFGGLLPANYQVVESQPSGFSSVSDTDGENNNTIGDENAIVVVAGTDNGNNDFVEAALGSVSGSVLAFTAASPDTAVAQPFVVVTLKDAAGNDIDSDGNPDNGVQPTTATTDEFGAYSFDNLPAADYQVVETQPAGFGSVSDIDGENNNTIGDENTLTVSPGETNSGNDFVNAELGSVSGNVTAFTAANAAGDAPLENVVLTLRDENGVDIDSNPATPEIEPTTTTTDSTGAYSFGGLLPANYQVVESQPSGFSSVSDTDGENNNTIGDENAIVVVAGTDNGDNDFVEAALGSVSGSVLAFTAASPDTAVAQAFVVVTLKDAAGNDIDSDGNPDNGVQPTTATTDEFGAYSFDNLPAADYQVVETQPAGFGSVSDIDGENNNTIGDENTLTVSPGETNSGNDFINAELGSVSGNVTAFTAANAAGDAPLENVVLTLRDENGADIDSNPATPEIEPTTTTTDSTGAYSFGGLLPANYQVVESQPSGFSSVSDTDGENNNTIGDENAIVVVAGTDNGNNDFVEAALGAISGFVLSDTDNDGDGDEGITGVTLTLQNADGSDIDSDGNPDNGVQPTTTQTLSGGAYLFENLPAGNYRVVESQPEGFDSVGDTDGENNNIIGDETAIVVVVGETAQNNNFVELADSSKADTFAEWSADFAQELGTQTGLGENPDGDIYPNALEYAFWLNPGLGLPDGGEFCLTKSADGTVTAEFQRRRGGLSDVTYTLEIADTLEIPTAWVEASSVSPTVTAGGSDIPFDAEMVSYNNLENASELTSANNGVVRLRVEVDANGNGSIESEEVFFTQIFGWQCVDYNDYQCATFANPFKAKPVLSGTFDPTGVLSLGTDPEGNVTLDVASAANGTDLVDVVGSDGEFYLQVTSGFLEGERFDILGGGVDSLTLINDPAIFDDENVVSLNTSNGIPADPMFNGASYQVIRHATVGDVFDESTIFAGEEDTNPSDTTRLLFFDSRRATPGFDILMLIGTNSSNARWVFSNDLGAQTDQANLRLDPSRGNWIHPKSSGDPANPATEAPVTQFTFGVVADYAQAVPINAGFNLLGAMWPLDQTPAGPNGRDWTVASGFDGGVDPNNATELLFWVGDAVADDLAVTNYTEGYENYMLLDGGGMQNWVDINDFFLTNQDELLNLESHRSVFLELLSGDEKEPHFYPLPNY